MPTRDNLPSPSELAAKSDMRFPNESDAYRRARTELLAEEIELRRHIERVAQLRRALPPGGEVTASYRFVGEDGPATLEELFGDKDTLFVYSWMYGPKREQSCPMCTSLLSSWDGEVPDIEQKIALAVVARSPIDRLVAFKNQRGWRHLRVFSDVDDAFSRDFFAVTDDGSDNAGANVFSRADGTIRHFWSGEMTGATADPGEDPRGAPDFMPLWTILDCTPEGRDPKWYPKLEYR